MTSSRTRAGTIQDKLGFLKKSGTRV
jgi:hypothetical protein